MTNGPSADPFSFFREALNQWEKAANDMGSKMLGSDQTAALMHKGTTAGLQVQTAMKDGMNKALSAANMPSKADIEALAAQIGGLDTRLARIETLLSGKTEVVAVSASKPKRTKKPPTP
jgi:hypothetical protein